MDFKSLLDQLSQLSEAKEETKTGVKHKAKPGRYGGYDPETNPDKDDDEKKAEPAAKRGRGRPKKGADSETGEVKKWDTDTLQSWIVGNKPKKLPGKASVKHTMKEESVAEGTDKKSSLKDWMKVVSENVPSGMKPLAMMDPQNRQVGAGVLTSKNPAVQKMLGGIDPNDVQIVQTTAQTSTQPAAGATGQAPTGTQPMKEKEGDYSAKKARAGQDIGKPGKQFSKIAKSAGERYGSKAAGERVAGAVLKNLRKADEGVSEASKKIPASNTPVKPEDLYVSLKDIPAKKPRGHTQYDPSKEFPGVKAFKKQGVAEGRLDELGNTPAGRTALRAVQKRGDDEITAWNKKPESGFSAAPDSARKHFSASIAAGNRLHGFRPDALKKNTVLARDALRRHQKGEPITPEEVEIIRKWYPGFKIDEGQQGVAEADIPSDQMDMGAGLGAGRSDKTFEGKKAKPDFLDIDKDKNKKESMKKAASDKKKKKVTESSHRHSAARLMGKSHALAKEGYNCRYEDMDEAREYHEGFKEGLDECYGQGVYETAPAMPPATVSGMASAAMPTLEDEMDMYEMDRTEYMRHKASTTPGDTFKAFGQTFNDTEVLETDSFFESLDNQLQALLESEQVDEGMTVSISKGQQGMPDSVSVTAQDAEAEQLLGLIKTAGLGLFGDQQSSDYGVSDQGKESHGDIEVVGDHDGMMSIMKKLTGQSDSQDYADEEDSEGTCDACGEYESDCGCDHEEQVDEVENDEQREFQVSEDNPPDTDAAETTADEEAEAAEDQALATQNVEEELNEWANDAGQSLEEFKEETFTTDDEFMIQTIAGGLNKPKSTGQTTIPVIAGQNDRMGYSTNESIGDWKKLAGLR
jgi:hypothetical protein